MRDLLLLHTLALSAVLTAAAFAPTADAQTIGARYSVGPLLTSTGFGVSGSARFSERFSASAEFSLAPTPDVDIDDIEGLDYSFDLSVRSLVVMGHYHPFGGGFALGLGGFFGGYGLEGSATPTESVFIGDEEYTPQELGTVTGDFSVGGPGLMLEIGRRGTGFNIGLGLVVPASTSAALSVSGVVGDDPAFRENAEAEVEDIEDTLAVVPVLPYLRIGYLIGL